MLRSSRGGVDYENGNHLNSVVLRSAGRSTCLDFFKGWTTKEGKSPKAMNHKHPSRRARVIKLCKRTACVSICLTLIYIMIIKTSSNKEARLHSDGHADGDGFMSLNMLRENLRQSLGSATGNEEEDIIPDDNKEPFLLENDFVNEMASGVHQSLSVVLLPKISSALSKFEGTVKDRVDVDVEVKSSAGVCSGRLFYRQHIKLNNDNLEPTFEAANELLNLQQKMKASSADECCNACSGLKDGTCSFFIYMGKQQLCEVFRINMDRINAVQMEFKLFGEIETKQEQINLLNTKKVVDGVVNIMNFDNFNLDLDALDLDSFNNMGSGSKPYMSSITKAHDADNYGDEEQVDLDVAGDDEDYQEPEEAKWTAKVEPEDTDPEAIERDNDPTDSEKEVQASDKSTIKDDIISPKFTRLISNKPISTPKLSILDLSGLEDLDDIIDEDVGFASKELRGKSSRISLPFKEQLLPQALNTNLAQATLDDLLPSGDYRRLISDNFYNDNFRFFYRFRTVKEINDMQLMMVQHFNSIAEAKEQQRLDELEQLAKVANSKASVAMKEFNVNLRKRSRSANDDKQGITTELESKLIYADYKTFGKSGDKIRKSLKVLQFGNPSRGKNLFIVAGIRGCEWVPSLAVIHSALTLLSRESPLVQKLLQSIRFHIIALANPDGFEYSRRNTPATAKHWCKNRRLIGQSHGVDLSRNFGVPPAITAESLKSTFKQKGKKKGKRAAIPMSTDEFNGMFNFSEPEVFSLRDYVSHFTTGRGRSALLNVRCCSGTVTFPELYSSNVEETISVETVATLFSKLISLESARYSVVKREEKLFGNIIDWAHSEMHMDHAYELNLKASGLTTRTNHNLISEEPFIQLSRELERAIALLAQLLLAQEVQGRPVDSDFIYTNNSPDEPQ